MVVLYFLGSYETCFVWCMFSLLTNKSMTHIFIFIAYWNIFVWIMWCDNSAQFTTSFLHIGRFDESRKNICEYSKYFTWFNIKYENAYLAGITRNIPLHFYLFWSSETVRTRARCTVFLMNSTLPYLKTKETRNARVAEIKRKAPLQSYPFCLQWNANMQGTTPRSMEFQTYYASEKYFRRCHANGNFVHINDRPFKHSTHGNTTLGTASPVKLKSVKLKKTNFTQLLVNFFYRNYGWQKASLNFLLMPSCCIHCFVKGGRERVGGV